ncbi:MAG: 2-oxo-4-hydroxy-4-carboxy-5-ureidoimidazoline decarboxylase [Gammaproteobacteria bacterium]|nr:2-oxo-4-hydroxy-4-carboxy-5-ureidoimidazoline decarboxylase [Gammaproteobacteria bacterium]NNM20655.1 2-oxo-4-hydroxy-4-carboxy-5-ureidoimidazoline decarboxylase [Gammaproteobacteria bacterium]
MYFRHNPHDMDEQTFLATFGGVYENSPWIAELLWQRGRLSGEVDKLAAKLAAIVNEAEREQQLELIRAHPELAGRAALAGELTAESADEQASAGLDQCGEDELEQLRELNAAYREKFGFPFILAVKGASRQQVLDVFSRRLKNAPEAEFENAMAEIHRIARLRLQEIAGRA